MNYYPFPFPNQNTNYNYINNQIDEINKIKERLKILEEKIKKIEKNDDYNYLKKDDNYYII